MATQQAPTLITVPAGSDLSTKQFYFMTVSSGNLALAGDGTRVVGVLTNKPNAAGEPGTLQTAGVAKVIAAGSITAGAGVASDADGKAVASAGADLVAGVALTGVSSGEYVEVILTGTASVATPAAAEQTVTTGAINPDIPICYLSVTGTKSYTLADGTHIGQPMRIECTVAATSPAGTLTINDAYLSEGATYFFDTVGQVIDLEWRTGGWKLRDKRRAGAVTVVVGTDVLTAKRLAARYNLSVTGTVTGAAASGFNIPNGTIVGERIDVQVTTAATCPAGEIDITALTLDGGAATKIDDIDGTTSHHAQFVWDGAAWQVVSITGLALA
jgi:hypothetical protein